MKMYVVTVNGYYGYGASISLLGVFTSLELAKACVARETILTDGDLKGRFRITEVESDEEYRLKPNWDSPESLFEEDSRPSWESSLCLGGYSE